MNKELVALAQRVALEWKGTDTYNQAATIIEMLLDELEKRHGRWERTPVSDIPFCSVCDTLQEWQRETPYCPICGARLDRSEHPTKD